VREAARGCILNHKQSMVKAVGGGSSEWGAARGCPRGPGAAMCGSRGWSCTAFPREVCHYSYLKGSVHKVVLQVSVPAQMRQIFFISVITMDNLTDLCGNCLLENDFINTRVVVYRIPAGGMPLFMSPKCPNLKPLEARKGRNLHVVFKTRRFKQRFCTVTCGICHEALQIRRPRDQNA
jgi:hypothetical protein